MSTKLKRYAAEREKARIKRDEWDAKMKEWDQKYRDQENEEIHDMVHAAGLSIEQLGVLIRMAQEKKPDPENLAELNEEVQYDGN